MDTATLIATVALATSIVALILTRERDRFSAGARIADILTRTTESAARTSTALQQAGFSVHSLQIRAARLRECAPSHLHHIHAEIDAATSTLDRMQVSLRDLTSSTVDTDRALCDLPEQLTFNHRGLKSAIQLHILYVQRAALLDNHSVIGVTVREQLDDLQARIDMHCGVHPTQSPFPPVTRPHP